MITELLKTLEQELIKHKDFIIHVEDIEDIITKIEIILESLLKLQPIKISYRLTDQVSIDLCAVLNNNETIFVEYYLPINNLKTTTKEEVFVNYNPEINRNKLLWSGDLELSLNKIETIKM